MTTIPGIISWLSSGRLEAIDSYRREPEIFQQKTFSMLLERAAATEWGKKYDFASVKGYSDFSGRIPVQTYDDFIPWIERIRNGEKDLLWPGEVKWFAKSSGTTAAKSKFIPMTIDSLEDCHYRAAKDLILVYLQNRPSSKILSGKGLTLGGSHRINRFSNNSLYGDLSAILLENAPFWSEFIKTPKKEIALLEDFEEKLAMITKHCSAENVTSISGVPSWYLVLIKQILAHTGKTNLLDVWPNLEVFFHGGVSFSPYRDSFRELIRGEQMQYMETYNASEGFFAIQDDPSENSMLLLPDYGIFYEFIPADKALSPSAPAYLLGEVEKGINYAIVISTNGGLWRYLMGDTVTFTSLFPHRIRITGRTKHFINVFGEEVIIDNAEKALEAACKATGAVITEYTAGPVYMNTESKGSHEWIIEFDREPPDIEKFGDILDEALKSVNSDYEAKRHKDMNLVRLIIRKAPPGSFNAWLRSKNKLGGQNKVPRLSNTREYIEEMYRIIGVS